MSLNGGRVALQYKPRRVTGDAASLSTQDKCGPEHTAALVRVVLTSQWPFWPCKVVTRIPACTEDEEREKAEALTSAETAKKEKQKNKKAKQKVGCRSTWPHMLANIVTDPASCSFLEAGCHVQSLHSRHNSNLHAANLMGFVSNSQTTIEW